MWLWQVRCCERGAAGASSHSHHAFRFWIGRTPVRAHWQAVNGILIVEAVCQVDVVVNIMPPTDENLSSLPSELGW